MAQFKSSLEIKPNNFLPFASSYLKWHFNHYVLGKSFPVIAQFYTTHTCNFMCSHCNFWRTPRFEYIPLEKFKSIISELSEMGCCFVNFTGGEPMILPDIFERIKFVKSKIPFMHMVSNGSIINEEKAKKLNETRIDSISISVNGLKKTYDDIAQVPEAWDKAVNALRILKANTNGIALSMNSVIKSDIETINELYKLLDMSKEIGVDHKLQAIMQHPEFSDYRSKSKQLLFKPNFPLDEIKKFIKYAKKQKHVINSHYYLDSVVKYFEGKNVDGLFGEDCKTPYYFAEFQPNGSFNGCLTGTDWKETFDATKRPLREILESKEYKAHQKNLEKCRACTKSMQICIVEPRAFFPFRNFLKYTVLPIAGELYS